MTEPTLTERYNYTEFTVQTALPWLRFGESPTIGQSAPDYPLWELDGTETTLSAIWRANDYTVVEFGSFT